MHKMVLVSEVAQLAKEIEKSRKEMLKKSKALSNPWVVGWDSDDLREMMSTAFDDSTVGEVSSGPTPPIQAKERIYDLLEQWEEPDATKRESVSSIFLTMIGTDDDLHIAFDVAANPCVSRRHP